MDKESARCQGCPARVGATCPPERKRTGILTLLNTKPVSPEAVIAADGLFHGIRRDRYVYKCDPAKRKEDRALHRRVSEIRTRFNRAGRVPQVPEISYF